MSLTLFCWAIVAYWLIKSATKAALKEHQERDSISGETPRVTSKPIAPEPQIKPPSPLGHSRIIPADPEYMRQVAALNAEVKARWPEFRRKHPSEPETPPNALVGIAGWASTAAFTKLVTEIAIDLGYMPRPKKSHPLAIIFATGFCITVWTLLAWAWWAANGH